MTNAWRASEVAGLSESNSPSPPVGEGRGPRAKRVGRVRGNGDGLTKRQLLPALPVNRSRELRRNAGPAERGLWNALRQGLPLAGFRHQAPFGPYHADFCSHAAKLIVEADDATHAMRRDQDDARTRFLCGEGYRVIRFWNNDVMGNIDGVIAEIAAALPRELRG
jgi:very-short-patch-repair endonuclease